MCLLGEPSEYGIDLASFKLPAHRQIQHFAMLPFVQGLALGVVPALPAGKVRKFLVHALLGGTAQAH